MIKYPDYSTTEISKINVPALILAGDHDLIREEHTLKLFQCIPHSQLFILPGTSHLFLFEKPELVNQTVDAFFSTPYQDLDRLYFLKWFDNKFSGKTTELLNIEDQMEKSNYRTHEIWIDDL